MKAKLLVFVLFTVSLSFGQNFTPAGFITPIPPAGLPPTTSEVFRFAPGLVTQLDAGTFNFGPSDRWFALGKLQTGVNMAYGLRFQNNASALLFGYQNLADVNPRIQWINNDRVLGALEFRVSNSFTSTNSTLVASMNSNGTTTFGDTNSTNGIPRVIINNSAEVTTADNTGLLVDTFTSQNTTSIRATAYGGEANAIGIFGEAFPSFNTLGFAAGIYGRAANFNNQQWAGFFDGRLFATSITRPSDERLKFEIAQEQPILGRLIQLKPVTYKFIESKELNLPRKLQHGFIAQDIEKVFPELVTEISKPIFDQKGKITGKTTFKVLEYEGMTSMLLAGIQELHQEIKILKEELAVLRSDKAATQLNTTETGNTGVFMKQNIPNPFTESTTISYQLPEGTTTADIMVFDFNGKPIKAFPINKNESEITISAAEIGKGLFIYSLVQNGQELVTKKMIIN